jgi:excisionase family DNA binding protein
MDERWLTVKQIAEHLQVTEATVNRWLRTSELRGVNFGGRTGYRIRESEFQRFLAEREGNRAA